MKDYFDPHKVIMRTKEAVYFSPALRRAQAYLYRLLNDEQLSGFLPPLAGKGSLKRVAVNLPSAHFIGHIIEIIHALDTNDDLTPIISTPILRKGRRSHVELVDRIKNEIGPMRSVNVVSFPHLKSIRPNIIFEVAVTAYGLDLPTPRLIYTHGMGGLNFSKDFRHVRFLKRYRGALLNGPIHRRALLAASKEHRVKLPDLFEVGYLRGDRLETLAAVFDKATFLRTYRLVDAPIVLFAPTWGGFSDHAHWLDIVARACAAQGCNLLIRMHPLDLSPIMRRKILELCTKHQFIRDAGQCDLDQLMLATDVVATDVSGISLEFLSIGKPAVFWESDRYFRIYGDDRPEKWIRPGGDIKTFNELKTRLNSILNTGLDDDYRSMLRYNHGKSLSSILDCLLQVANSTHFSQQ